MVSNFFVNKSPQSLAVLVEKQLEIFHQTVQQFKCKTPAAFDVFSKLQLLKTKLETHPYERKKRNKFMMRAQRMYNSFESLWLFSGITQSVGSVLVELLFSIG